MDVPKIQTFLVLHGSNGEDSRRLPTVDAGKDKPTCAIVDAGEDIPTGVIDSQPLRPILTSESGEGFNIFVIGITGYIGGTVTRHITKAHPELKVAALVRNERYVPSVLAMFPGVRIVRGALNDRDIIIEECSKAKIVILMAKHHEEGLLTIIEGIRCGEERDCGYLIYTSDLSVLIDKDFPKGEFDTRVADDVVDLNGIKERLSANPTQLDTTIMNAAADNTEDSRSVRTAIICPSAIYGFGKGPIRKRGGAVTALLRAIMKFRHAFKVENGRNHWSLVDIDNLAEAYLAVVELALDPRAIEDGRWNSEGYYVAETEELCWGELAKYLGERVDERFFINEPVVARKLETAVVETLHPGKVKYWGTNARCIGSRLRQIGWNPERADLADYINQRLSLEIARIYGISVEEQELEVEERRPDLSGFLDYSPISSDNVDNNMNEDHLSPGLSMEVHDPAIQYATSEEFSTDEESSTKEEAEEPKQREETGVTEETDEEKGEKDGEGGSGEEGSGEEGSGEEGSGEEGGSGVGGGNGGKARAGRVGRVGRVGRAGRAGRGGEGEGGEGEGGRGRGGRGGGEIGRRQGTRATRGTRGRRGRGRGGRRSS
ncbi:hypothetical protein V493_07321 [Pseudogymnoascus sp. VKM F-4281 (FW-2241)]|nr:hypothetical protein V493_07321 [Pseudogymnoascus sp. VKM F-4281 (FW-2241)]